ncbi:MAG: hypothetical protein ACFFDH_18535 [Promethearchaeota archaeon]
MLEKIGIIIKNEKAPKVSSEEIKSILSSLGVEYIDTLICDNASIAKRLIKEKFEEISFIYLTNPIPNIEKATYELIEYIKNNKNYQHIEFFARMPNKEKESKYKWYDDFINFIKF